MPRHIIFKRLHRDPQIPVNRYLTGHLPRPVRLVTDREYRRKRTAQKENPSQRRAVRTVIARSAKYQKPLP